MKRHEISAHIADVRLLVQATTLPELFNAALEGMANIITPVVRHEVCHETFQLTVHAIDTTVLLIDFLSDVLTQTHITRILYCKAEFELLTETSLQATLYGHTVQNFETDIKAVTYHQAEVKKNSRGDYETMIVFDI